MTQSQDDFLRRVKATLDESSETLDSATLARLTAVRREALQRGQRRYRWLLPVGGAALASIVVVMLIISTPVLQIHKRSSKKKLASTI